MTSTGRLLVSTTEAEVELHPVWLRERSLEPGQVDPVNQQRLFEPHDLDPGVGVVDCSVVPSNRDAITSGPLLEITFDDGHRMTITVEAVERAAMSASGQNRSAEAPPAAVAWAATDIDVPLIDYRRLSKDRLGAVETKREMLSAFFELGFFVITHAPAEVGALHAITAHLGRISPTNFGSLFDVETTPAAIDLAYTPVALSAHTDQPYRTPTPGIQFLHTIVNDAPGGASTVVDGLAAVDDLARVDPEAHASLCAVPVEFRYDIGSDVKTVEAPIIDRRSDGSLRQFRFSPRLDFAPLVDPDVLETFYRGRRWLAEQLNDPARQIEYRMKAGEVLVVDNHRVLHGRTAFDPTRGARHLQGCYIDHDGPLTEWILSQRTQERKRR